MSETAYSPDPRPSPPIFHPSREFGGSGDGDGDGSSIVNQYEISDAGYDDMAIDFFEDYQVGAISSLTEGLGWGADGVVTGGTIVSRTHTDGRAMKALSMVGGQFGRRLPWGGKWHRMKLVVLFRINHGATFTTVVNQLLGICSGTTNMAGSATCDNFIGLRFGSTSGENFTFTAGTGMNYFSLGTTFRFASKRGTTITVIAAGGNGFAIPSTEGWLGALMYSVWRPVFATDATSVTYSHYQVITDGTLVQFSRTKNIIRRVLQDQASSAGAATATETAAIGQAGPATGSFDQSTGVLDTFNFVWAEATVPIEIYGIGIKKIA